VTDSTQGGTPPQNPYGTQGSSGENPYGQPPAGDTPPQTYGQTHGQTPGQPAYGQSSAEPPANPSGAPPASNPYAPASSTQPQGQPYGQYTSPYGQEQPPPGPLGDGLDMYGRPLNRRVTDGRPGTATAAGWITIVMSGLTGALFAFFTVAMIVAKDEFLVEVDKAIAEQGGATGDFDAESAYGIVVGILLVFTIWCVIATVLGVMVLRRGKVARILLIISAVVAALLSLLLIASVLSALWLIACVLVIVLLFAGGASEWFRDRY
jgi:hypothetical protein